MKRYFLPVLVLSAGALMASVAHAQVKLGVAGPVTGPNAAFGAQLANGAEQAVADINAAGGILGQKLEVVLGDDVSDPRQGVSVANKLAGEGVKFVVGHFNSGVSIPASEIYAESGIVQITPASTNPQFTERGLPTVFRTCGRDDQQGEVAGNFILKTFKAKKVAVVHDKTPYGKGLADETRKVINKGGLQEVVYEGVNPGEKDFTALVSKLKSAGVEFMYWGGLHTELGLIIRQMRDQGMNITAMGADGIVSEEFASIGGPGVEGTKMTFPPDPRKRPEVQEIVKRFTEQRKFNPEAYTLYSYAAVQVIKQAAEKAGSLEPKKVAEAMKSGMIFKTVVGDISYDRKGDRTRPDYVVYSWRKGADGKITYIED
ncbi:branched chain amino acid ABC transporter substrate-binding protein [Microvirga sp. KLBC 81]|uniref:branched-chain amino acid ABC transporter substrate-binding protein n=1 Tax=Microvirga sp. KLBC 81 TaxID=1862707 RepID=UPI000D5073A8|nr:branched-chain amino acid ABC transporter substrate-binding protein [Microvirga sp. KLBC 81]PVE23773.1 branched chain amino acid ABC transporter substrate-binding protein [Microvirga sp. KLBC 81]